MIFHADCNNFFASCECLERPELKNVPMAVAGDPKARTGIVLAKNDLAKKFGVRTTDTVYTAQRKCANIVFVPPRHRYYKQISDRVNAVYLEYTDLVEPASIDESYIDYTCADPVAFADNLRRRIREEIGITISVGVSYCKVFAKMGSDYRKPDATTVISRENFRDIIWPLPVSDLMFVGKASAEALNRRYIMTVGDLARAPLDQLRTILGKQGDMLHAYANGIDNERVRRFGERDAARSVSHGMTFPHDLCSSDEIRTAVSALSDSVSQELRKLDMKGTVIEVKLRRPDLTVMSRQLTLSTPTDLQHDIRHFANQLIRENIAPGAPIRSITIGVSSLVSNDEPVQLSMFDADHEHRQKVEDTLLDIRSRFGRDTISLGAYAGKDTILRK